MISAKFFTSVVIPAAGEANGSLSINNLQRKGVSLNQTPLINVWIKFI